MIVTQSPERYLPSRLNIHFKYFFILMSLFSATWLTSDIAAVKLVSVFGITLTGGFIVFPFTTMLSGIIVEVYGYKNARQAIWAGFIINLAFVFFINIVSKIPPSPIWNHNDAFNLILSPGTRIIFASLTSFIFADFFNSYFMAKLKVRSHGKSLIKRVLFSCSISFLIDIVFFLTVAFYGTIPNHVLAQLIGIAYLKKMLCQITLFPLTYYLITLLKRKEGVEIFDYDTKFNPFNLENIYELNSFKKPELKAQRA